MTQERQTAPSSSKNACSCQNDAAAEPASAPAPCCPSKPYKYGRTPWIIGSVESGAGPVPQVAAKLNLRDHLAAVRVRWGIRRNHYRVPPGLYAVGSPLADSPVLLTANFKLTFDALRRELSGMSAWLLVLDTRGINVWCAAGKGTFSTDEIVRRVEETGLSRVATHRRLIVPQLGATGVAKHLVRERCGFTVTYGPVRAADLPAFVQDGHKATPQMRTVHFPLWQRVKLIPVEASVLWKGKAVAAVLVLAFLAGLGGRHALHADDWGVRVGVLYGLLLMPVLAGSVIVPAALPFIPGRAFATKGALVGALLAAGTVAGLHEAIPPLALAGVFLGITALSSYWAMTFTGSSTFTSPSGVEKEMRHALPPQLAAGSLAVLLFIAQFVLRLVGVEL